MSYILDALKKAERQRELAKVPTLATVHQTAESSPRRVWPWIAGAVILANVGILAWLVGSPPPPPPDSPVHAAGEPARPEPAMKPTDQAATARSEPETEVAPAAPPAAPAASPARSPLPASRPAARAAEATAPSKSRPPAAAVAAAPPAEVAAPKRAEAVPPTAGRVAPPTKVAGVPDKPAEPAAAKPPPPDIIGKIRLQFLVYSEVPAERLVFINNQKYLEGQSIEGKVTVERIMPDGVVLGYQGERIVLRAEGAVPR